MSDPGSSNHSFEAGLVAKCVLAAVNGTIEEVQEKILLLATQTAIVSLMMSYDETAEAAVENACQSAMAECVRHIGKTLNSTEFQLVNAGTLEEGGWRNG